MQSILDFPSIGPYMGVTRNMKIAYKVGRKYRNFRIIVYGAFNAFGLIGPEKNGIAILDEDKMQVLCDEINIESSGYFGPSEKQLCAHEKLCKMEWADFQSFINGHGRSRYSI